MVIFKPAAPTVAWTKPFCGQQWRLHDHPPLNLPLQASAPEEAAGDVRSANAMIWEFKPLIAEKVRGRPNSAALAAQGPKIIETRNYRGPMCCRIVNIDTHTASCFDAAAQSRPPGEAMFWVGLLIGAMVTVALEAAMLLWSVQRDRWRIARNH
jgi:hypothetical protein